MIVDFVCSLRWTVFYNMVCLAMYDVITSDVIWFLERGLALLTRRCMCSLHAIATATEELAAACGRLEHMLDAIRQVHCCPVPCMLFGLVSFTSFKVWRLSCHSSAALGNGPKSCIQGYACSHWCVPFLPLHSSTMSH